MPRLPRFIHPVRAVRQALKKTQRQFAKMFGVSTSYLQAIELGTRKVPDHLADSIMLRFGVDPDSLKNKHGRPEFLLASDKMDLFYGGLRAPNTPLTNRVLREFDERKTLADEHEQWRRAFAFWHHLVLPAWQHDHARVHGSLTRKLNLLLEAAQHDNNFHCVALHLTRLIDALAREYRLHTIIDAVSIERTGHKAQWPSFMETISPSFRLKQKRSTR